MNLPNKITLFRTILIPIFIVFLLYNMGGSISILCGRNITLNIFIAALIFMFASFTDFIDGYLARKYNLVTNMGKFLDPLADKLLVGSAFIVMVELGLMHSWMVVVVIAREFAVTGIPAGILGKLKTISQLLAIILILLGNPIFNSIGFELDYILLWISVILTILSGLEYFKNSLHVFK